MTDGNEEGEVSLERLAEASPVAILKVDGEGDIVYANGRAEEVLGLKEGRLEGKAYTEVDWGLVENEGAGKLTEILPFQPVRDSGEPVRDVKRTIELPGGERRLISIDARPLYDERGDFDGAVSVIRDVTDQVSMEEELRRNEERYRKYFEKTGDGIFVVKMGGKDHGLILEVNSTAVQQTGYSREELLGMNVVEDIAVGQPEEMDFEEADEKLFRGETVNYTQKKRRKDGSEYWTDVIVTPLEHEGKRANLSINRDITEKKRVREELERERREKSVLLRNLPGMAYKSENDREWTMKFVSDGCRELTGYGPEELIGNSLVSYGDLIVEEDRERIWEKVQGRLENDQPFRLEYRIRTKEGKIKWVWERGRGIYYRDGRLKNLQGIITDVTERKNVEFELKRSERKFRSYVENAPVGVNVVDEEGNYVEVNGAACEMTGYSEEEMLEMKVPDLHPPEATEEVKEAFEELLETGEMSSELPYLRKDGSKGYFVIDAVRISEERFLGFTLDVTKRKEAQEELERATIGTLQALNRTIEAKDEYTGEHIDRVQQLSVEVGRRIGLSEERLEQLRYASILHDIGKIGVPDSVLGKPAELTEEEWEEMERHPEIGKRIVGQVKQLERAARVIGQHQECYDGTGYPEGLEGEEITLEARIVAVADAWDAMRTDRPYREALPREEAVKEIKDNAGTQFDPEVVDIVLETLEDGETEFGME